MIGSEEPAVMGTQIGAVGIPGKSRSGEPGLLTGDEGYVSGEALRKEAPRAEAVLRLG